MIGDKKIGGYFSTGKNGYQHFPGGEAAQRRRARKKIGGKTALSRHSPTSDGCINKLPVPRGVETLRGRRTGKC
jgi:hypothetical protein